MVVVWDLSVDTDANIQRPQRGGSRPLVNVSSSVTASSVSQAGHIHTRTANCFQVCP